MMTLTRRSLLTATPTLAFGVPLLSALAQEAESESKAKLGDTRDAFDAEYGDGVEENGFIGYLTDREDVAHYHVAFNEDGIAEAIEIDFKHLPEGGLSLEEADLGTSRFLRDDATQGPLLRTGLHRADHGNYTFVAWHSPSLQQDTGRSGNVIVMDNFGIGAEGPMAEQVIHHTILSMETFEETKLQPTGSELGPDDSYDTWQQEMPDHTEYQWGWMSLDDAPIAGSWLVGDGNVVIVPEPPLPLSDAHDVVTERMPAGDVVWTTLFRPGPVGGEYVRVHGVESEGRQYVAGQWIAGDEKTGEVLKIMLGS